MAIGERLKNFIVRLRGLSDVKKKIIFFPIMGIAVVGAIFLGIKLTKDNVLEIQKSLKSESFLNIQSSFKAPSDAQLSASSSDLNLLNINSNQTNQ